MRHALCFLNKDDSDDGNRAVWLSSFNMGYRHLTFIKRRKKLDNLKQLHNKDIRHVCREIMQYSHFAYIVFLKFGF